MRISCKLKANWDTRSRQETNFAGYENVTYFVECGARRSIGDRHLASRFISGDFIASPAIASAASLPVEAGSHGYRGKIARSYVDAVKIKFTG